MTEFNPYQSPEAAAELPSKWKAWARTRVRGRKRFLWINGVLGWGLPVGIFWSTFTAWSQGWDRFLLLLVIALVVFPIGGYLWGQWMWQYMERHYLKALGETEPDPN